MELILTAGEHQYPETCTRIHSYISMQTDHLVFGCHGNMLQKCVGIGSGIYLIVTFYFFHLGINVFALHFSNQA